MELTKEILQELAKPFPASAISIKVQTKPNENGKSLCVAYIDARDVMERLDTVIGGEWSDDYRNAPAGGLECALTVCGVTRRDVGDSDNENETEKAGYSDAFKRAAVKFGIGRFLYGLPKMYAQTKTFGKNSYLADGEEERLRGILANFLSGAPMPAQAPQKPREAQKAAAPRQETPKQSNALPMTLAEAMETQSNDGTLYRDRDTSQLTHVFNNPKTPDFKKEAARLIIEDRRRKQSEADNAQYDSENDAKVNDEGAK